MMHAAEKAVSGWVQACRLDDIMPNTGVCCLLGREQVAVFRVGEGETCFAIGNFDPFSRANVLSRGIVGDRAGTLKVASPMYKQSFCLETGVCLDDPSVRVPVYDVRVVDGFVELRRNATRVLLGGNIGMLSEAQSN
jgi:nitrite reductase (NADH) small subunit